MLEIPKSCPSCGSVLTRVNDQLFCSNSKACPAQLTRRLQHFVATIGIKGLGPAGLEKLDLQDIPELFYTALDTYVAKLGRIGSSIYEQIQKLPSRADMATSLAAFGIPKIGLSTAQKACKNLSKVEQLTYSKCREQGLGEVASESLSTWVLEEYPDYANLPIWNPVKTALVHSTKTVCISGKLVGYKTKADAYKVLEEAGFTVVESVTKSLSYLVAEPGSNSSKITTANKYSIPVVSMQDLLKVD